MESAADLKALRMIAIQSVEAGMRVAKDWRDQGADLQVQVTDAASEYDRYVTAVDHAAEAAITDIIRQNDPDAIIIGEQAVDGTMTGRVWIVDPIDGTTNLVKGSSFVSVAVALLIDGRPAVAATGCPFTHELWSAAAGFGTFDRMGVREGACQFGPGPVVRGWLGTPSTSWTAACFRAGRGQVTGSCTRANTRPPA
jgi:fructose-1,6-bisphosphatase/inositol monophosphatase family enzyme